MKDETQYKIKDLYGKFEDLKSNMSDMKSEMNKGFARIEEKLDSFIQAQSNRDSAQEKNIQELKTQSAVQDTKQGMIAGGLTVFSTVAALITYYLTSGK